MSFSHPALKANAVAVVTGASAGGIGYEIAKTLATTYSATVVLVDIDSANLTAAADALLALGVPESRVLTQVVDLTVAKEVFELADTVYQKFGKVDFLAANAGATGPSKDFGEGGDLDAWNRTLGVNLFGVLHTTQAFVARMVQQDTPGLVVITGSKQGITQPPGNPAYNVSKSAVKSLAESLAHSLLPTKLTAHLLVPGYTYTKITTGSKGVPDANSKPAAAWTPAQVAEQLFSRLDEFYIICPDNDVTWELDAARMAWNADDILKKRPALSRWNPEYEAAYAKYIEEKIPKK